MPDSALLAGDVYIANLRHVAHPSVSEKEALTGQCKELLETYANLIDVRSVVQSMYGDGGPGAAISTDEIREFAKKIKDRREQAQERHALKGRWCSYYAERFWLPWLPSLYRLAELYAHAEWGWFDEESVRSSVREVRVACGMRPSPVVVRIVR